MAEWKDTASINSQANAGGDEAAAAGGDEAAAAGGDEAAAAGGNPPVNSQKNAPMDQGFDTEDGQNGQPIPRRASLQEGNLEEQFRRLHISGERHNRYAPSPSPTSSTDEFYNLAQYLLKPKKRKPRKVVSPRRLEYVRRRSRELRQSLEACEVCESCMEDDSSD